MTNPLEREALGVEGRDMDSSAARIPTEQADRPVVAFGHFQRGAQACREMMARFVEVTHPQIAQSIRLNWHPGWGGDPGQPPFVAATWEPFLCPEGEASYASYQATEHNPEPDLALTATMLETWGPVVEPASPDGRVSFTRAMMASAAESIRAHLAQNEGVDAVECETCAGSGKIVEEARTTGANQHSSCQSDCDECDGTGRLPTTPAETGAVGIFAPSGENEPSPPNSKGTGG